MSYVFSQTQDCCSDVDSPWAAYRARACSVVFPVHVRNDASVLQRLSSPPPSCHIWIWLLSSAPLSAVGDRDRGREGNDRRSGGQLGRCSLVHNRAEPRSGELEGHFTFSSALTDILHLLCPASVSPASSFFSSPSFPPSCPEYDELQPAGKPCAGDSVPARAHHHRPEPAESHPDAALPDRGAGPAGGRAHRREQAPAGRQGTTASCLPSPPSPSPRPQLPCPPPPPSGPPAQDWCGISAGPCVCSSTSRGGSCGRGVAFSNYGSRGHAAGPGRPVHGFPGGKWPRKRGKLPQLPLFGSDDPHNPVSVPGPVQEIRVSRGLYGCLHMSVLK